MKLLITSYVLLIGSFAFISVDSEAADARAKEFQSSIKPLLENYCFDCHADGESKGNVAF